MDTSEKSRFSAPYGPDRYRRLNQHFQACAHLPAKERERYVRGADTGLREELRSLLHFHAPEASPPEPAPPARPAWVRRPLWISGIGALSTLAILALGAGTLPGLESGLKESAERMQRDVLESRASRLASWAGRQKDSARVVLESPDLVSQVGALAEAADASPEALEASPSYRYVFERMTRVPPELGERGFMIVDRSGVVLCSQDESLVGASPPPEGAAARQRMLSGTWVLDPGLVGGPIRDPRGRVRAMALFHFAPERELLGLLSAPAPLALSLVEDVPRPSSIRIADLERRLEATVDRSAVLAPARPLRMGFGVLLALPGLVTLGILLPTVLARVRRPPGPGARLGPYRLERRLGQGGMAEVFLGRHAILGRPAALKILHPGRIATARRFEQEARLASRLEHPNLVQVFEFGETPEGRLYYAMEYVRGLTLAQLLALEGRLPLARAIYLLLQIADALGEAQRAGLLHRDLKPANIMVSSRGGAADVIKVLDFGIACPIAGGDVSPELVGTPAYIAPERIRLLDARDPRSDVYSFGAVAFHLLTGRNVFEGSSPAELIYQSLTAERPSASQFRGALLPEPLESLIRSCLSLDPESRPSDFHEIRVLLRSVETPGRWDQEDARAWWSDNEERVAMFS
jgi:hypothetical protein